MLSHSEGCLQRCLKTHFETKVAVGACVDRPLVVHEHHSQPSPPPIRIGVPLNPLALKVVPVIVPVLPQSWALKCCAFQGLDQLEPTRLG